MSQVDVKSESLTEMYRVMKRIRLFEECVIRLFQEGEMNGFTHACIGQEAVSAGVGAELEVADRVASNHRNHGHLIAKGADMSKMMAEILGKQTGYCRGMGGEMHIVDPSVGIIGANGIVGANLPIAIGAALADKMRGNSAVTAVFFGDGATSEGTFAESLNIAALWKLPVLFVCENNLYGEFTPASDAVAGQIFERGLSYGIESAQVDGQDALAVRAYCRDAVARARAGQGPTLMEAQTYRFHGHTYGEEALTGGRQYRSREELEHWRQNRDPLVLALAAALGAGVDAGVLNEIDGEVAAEISAAESYGRESPFPPVDQALRFLFTEPTTTTLTQGA